MTNPMMVEVPAGTSPLGPGEFYFAYGDKTVDAEPRGIIHGCPCGCGTKTLLWFRGRSGRPGGAEWDVTGEWPNVTLNPSVGIRYDAAGNLMPGGDYHWHGWVRNGEWIRC